MASTLKLPVGIENLRKFVNWVSIILTRQGLLSSSYRDGGRLLFLPALAVLVRLSI